MFHRVPRHAIKKEFPLHHKLRNNLLKLGTFNMWAGGEVAGFKVGSAYASRDERSRVALNGFRGMLYYARDQPHKWRCQLDAAISFALQRKGSMFSAPLGTTIRDKWQRCSMYGVSTV